MGWGGSPQGRRSKGLRSVAQQLGTTEYPRLRIGIGPVPPRRDASDFVLARFTPDEREPIAEAIERASEAIVLWCERGIDECMNQFN